MVGSIFIGCIDTYGKKAALYKRTLKGSQTFYLNELAVPGNCRPPVENQVAAKILVNINRGEKSERFV